MNRRKKILIWQNRKSAKLRKRLQGSSRMMTTDYTEELKEAEEELSIAQRHLPGQKELSKSRL